MVASPVGDSAFGLVAPLSECAVSALVTSASSESTRVCVVSLAATFFLRRRVAAFGRAPVVLLEFVLADELAAAAEADPDFATSPTSTCLVCAVALLASLPVAVLDVETTFFLRRRVTFFFGALVVLLTSDGMYFVWILSIATGLLAGGYDG